MRFETIERALRIIEREREFLARERIKYASCDKSEEQSVRPDAASAVRGQAPERDMRKRLMDIKYNAWRRLNELEKTYTV